MPHSFIQQNVTLHYPHLPLSFNDFISEEK